MSEHKKDLLDSKENNLMRINKYLSEAGLCSRRQADVYIEKGLITIDGQVAVMGSKVGPNSVVKYNKKIVKLQDKLVLIAFNKPRGIVCTAEKREKDNIIDYINYSSRIYPIGRLDKDSEGLILLTNYGELVNKIMRSANQHEKEYIVTVNKRLDEDFVRKMENGIPILDTVTRKCKVIKVNDHCFKIVLTQGLNRQIRRMCEYLGYKVVTLKRVRIMNIALGDLKVGQYRDVTNSELEKLQASIKNSRN